MKCRWVLVCLQPKLWRCSDWPKCKEMRFGKQGYSGVTVSGRVR